MHLKTPSGKEEDHSAIAKTTAIVAVIVIIIIAAIGGTYYYYYVNTNSQNQSQTLTFGFEATDATHADTVDALNHISQYGVKANAITISDPATLTSAGAHGQVDIFSFQFATTTIGAIEEGVPLVAIGEESTSFLQDLVVAQNITTFQQLNGTTMAAFTLDGPVLFPLVFAAAGQNFSQYNINLQVIGDSTVKAEALIAGKFVGAFLDPEDAATVFKAAPGKFHILATTASALPGIGGGLYFANKSWLNSHFQVAVDFIASVLESARNATQNLPAWINSTWNKNYTSLDFSTYNSTQYILQAADYFSPNMVTFTPALMNASQVFMYQGGLINSTGNVNQIYNFSVLQAALKMLGTVPEPAGPYQSDQPLAIMGPANSARVIGSDGVFAVPAAVLSTSESEK